MPSADWRQWLLWTIAAVLVPLLCAVLASGSSGFALFGALLVCFAAGTAAGEYLLGRVVVPVKRRAPAPPVPAPGAVPDQQRALPSSEPRREAPQRSGDAAAFASSRDAGALLEITLLAARGPEVPDPSIGVLPGSGMLTRDDRPLRPGPMGGDGSSATAPDDTPTQEVQRIDLDAVVDPAPRADAGTTTGRESALDAESAGVPEAGESWPGPAVDIPVPQTSSPAASAPPSDVAHAAHPFPGALRAKADGRSPDKSYRVKGNSRSKLYHTMQSPYYERTKATVWFRSAAEAEQAGFAPWNWRAHNDN